MSERSRLDVVINGSERRVDMLRLRVARRIRYQGSRPAGDLVPAAPPLGCLMRLTEDERAMLAGAAGEPRRWAIEHQIAVGEFFDAADLVPVSQAHIMADTESLGEAGIRFLESLAASPGAGPRLRLPTLPDPRR